MGPSLAATISPATPITAVQDRERRVIVGSMQGAARNPFAGPPIVQGRVLAYLAEQRVRVVGRWQLPWMLRRVPFFGFLVSREVAEGIGPLKHPRLRLLFSL